jgi:hypothetical protein
MKYIINLGPRPSPVFLYCPEKNPNPTDSENINDGPR